MLLTTSTLHKVSEESIYWLTTVDTTRICAEWIFDSPQFVYLNFFFQILTEFGSSHLHASFATFCGQIGSSFESQWVFEHSQYFEIGDIFLRKRRFVDVQAFFKDSLWRKRCQKKRKKYELPISIRIFTKISCCVKDLFSTYARMY